MKIVDIDSLIDEFRNGRDVWSKHSVELAVREIERLRNRVAELEREQRPRWRDTKTEKPNTGQLVYVLSPNKHIYKWFYHPFCYHPDLRPFNEYTHWIPVGEILPEVEK